MISAQHATRLRLFQIKEWIRSADTTIVNSVLAAGSAQATE
jgi:hypothetical protein